MKTVKDYLGQIEGVENIVAEHLLLDYEVGHARWSIMRSGRVFSSCGYCKTSLITFFPPESKASSTKVHLVLDDLEGAGWDAKVAREGMVLSP